MSNVRHGARSRHGEVAGRSTHTRSQYQPDRSEGGREALAEAEKEQVTSQRISPGTHLIGKFENMPIDGPATVFADEDGLHILDGALFLEDEFGSTVAGASGFAGGWADFVSTGLYNSRFLAGTPGGLVDGRSSQLPYWTVSLLGSGTATLTSDGIIEIVCPGSGQGCQVTSDRVPVRPGGSYGASARVLLVSGGARLTLTISEYDSSDALVDDYAVVSAAFDNAGYVVFRGDAVRLTEAAAYVRVSASITGFFASAAANLGGVGLYSLDAVPAIPEGFDASATPALTTSASAVAGSTFIGEINVGYLIVGIFDFNVTGSGVGVCVGELYQVASLGPDTVQAQQALYGPSTTGRATVSQIWYVPAGAGLGGGDNPEFYLAVRKTINAGTAVVNATHTRLLAIPVIESFV